jgi:L-amino acid N-acyltransferase YncA
MLHNHDMKTSDDSTRAKPAQPITVRDATIADMPAVLVIYNEAVANTTASYDYEPRSLAEQEAIYTQRVKDGLPFMVASDAQRVVIGFASYGPYRPRPGWRFACEHSVYVAVQARGQGVASLLMQPLMVHARAKGFHTMVGVVDAANEASLKLHAKHGFTTFGVMKEGGFKFDRWLDVAFIQAIL